MDRIPAPRFQVGDTIHTPDGAVVVDKMTAHHFWGHTTSGRYGKTSIRLTEGRGLFGREEPWMVEAAT